MAVITRRELIQGGLWSAAALGTGVPLGCTRSARKDPKLILLITLDTTRADHLGCYGYDRPTSPNIDRLAAESLVYEHAIASGTWTLPSHASLFTGKFAASHGVRYDPQGSLHLTHAIEGPEEWNAYRVRALSVDEMTLAGLLQRAGYRTGGVVAGPWLKRVFGLDRGFDLYDDTGISSLSGRLAHDVTDSALHWLQQSSGEPRFLFLNYFDPHIPYEPPEEFERMFLPGGVRTPPGVRRTYEEDAGLYDGEIRYMDHHVGRLFDGLKQLGLYDGSWIIVTSDHGELLGEHGLYGHGSVPFQELVHIPMIVKEPGGSAAPSRIDVPIQLPDVLPLILDRLELPIPPGIQGGVPPQIGHPIVFESRTVPGETQVGNWLGLIEGTMKFLWNDKGNHRLVDLERDPAEENNLLHSRIQLAKAMHDSMVGYLGALPRPGPEAPARAVDPETVEALKGLGYIE